MRDYTWNYNGTNTIPTAKLATELIHRILAKGPKLGPIHASLGVTVDDLRDRLQLELEISAMGLGEVD